MKRKLSFGITGLGISLLVFILLAVIGGIVAAVIVPPLLKEAAASSSKGAAASSSKRVTATAYSSLPPKPGCMNAESPNYNPEATVDDGSCQPYYPGYGEGPPPAGGSEVFSGYQIMVGEEGATIPLVYPYVETDLSMWDGSTNYYSSVPSAFTVDALEACKNQPEGQCDNASTALSEKLGYPVSSDFDPPINADGTICANCPMPLYGNSCYNAYGTVDNAALDAAGAERKDCCPFQKDPTQIARECTGSPASNPPPWTTGLVSGPWCVPEGEGGISLGNDAEGSKIPCSFGTTAFFAGCIGASCLIQTPQGSVELGNLSAGDSVLSWNPETQKTGFEKLVTIFTHGKEKIPHLIVTTTMGDSIVVTPDHLMYLHSGTRVQAQDLKVGDKFAYSSVSSIKPTMDIPLTPVPLSRTLLSPDSTIISSWCGSEDNVTFMDGLVSLCSKYISENSTETVDKTLRKAYAKLRSVGKNPKYISSIAREFDIPIPV